MNGREADEAEPDRTPVVLSPVADLEAAASRLAGEVRDELLLLLPPCEIEHVGATSVGSSVTKGDVDVNVRVHAEHFRLAVQGLSGRFAIAQPENWTASFASFSAEGRDLPLGIQVTVVDGPEDSLVRIRDLLRTDSRLRARYDRCKQQAAPFGPRSYWEAKNRMLQDLLGAGS